MFRHGAEVQSRRVLRLKEGGEYCILDPPTYMGRRDQSTQGFESRRHGVTGVAEVVFDSERVSSVGSDSFCRSVDDINRASSTRFFFF